MTACDMCGKNSFLIKVKIEGSLMEVCKECAKFGSVVSTPKQRFGRSNTPRGRAPVERKPEIVQLIVSDYSTKIRAAREKMGLTQEEFARKLNEKTSIMQKIEAGQFRPSIKLARKLERKLKINLVEEQGETEKVPIGDGKKDKSAGFCLGDFIKDKRKKD